MLARKINRWIAMAVCPAMALCQDAAKPSDTRIRVTSRIVYVDVVVRDRSGQIVPGLTQQDFHVEEDGKPQTIDWFSAQSYDTAAAAQVHRASVAAKPGGPVVDFSNVAPEGEQTGAVNIILFDLANTAVEDQLEAHKQLVKFLRGLPSGQKVALFALTDKLTMIQNFTGSSDRLIEAARQLDPKDAGVILSKASQMQGDDTAAEFARQFGRSPSGGASAMGSQLAINAATDAGSRARITVAAFDALAREVGAYPGRKNLMWLAESFPIALGAQVDETKKYSSLAVVPGAREAAGLIASAQIAVYPISLLGLEAGDVGPAASGVGQVSLGSGGGGPSVSEFNSRQALKAAMNDIADQTGGEAFAGTNDFARALRRSMVDGSNYYTLAYQPRNHNWNGQFRKLHVELAKRGYSLSYRRGYFALADASQPGTNLAALNAALQPQMPEATMLPLRSKVEVPESGTGIVRVSSVVRAQDLSLVSSEDGHQRGQLLVLLVAFHDAAGAGQPAAPPQTSALLNLDFDAAQYQAVLANGIAFTQQLKLASGRYRLRLGVSDLGGHRLGTLDMQAEVGAAARKGN